MRRVSTLGQILGVGVILLVIGKYHAAVVASPPYDFSNSFRFWWTAFYGAAVVFTAYAFGLPEVGRTPKHALLAAVGATSVAAIAVSAVQLLLGVAVLPRFVVFGGAGLLVPWFVGMAALGRDARSWSASRDRVVVVADWMDASDLELELSTSSELPATISANLSPREALATATGTWPLRDRAIELDATVVVLDRAAELEPSIIEQAAALHEKGVRIRTLSIFSEEWLGKVPLSELERVSLMFDIGELHRVRYSRIKRLLDVLVAVCLLPLFMAVIPLVCVGNLCGNRGSLWFSQVRVGRHGRRFVILKFRTMRSDAEGSTDWTGEKDPRITPFGSLLRRTHVDELPQLLNILRGDLSVVGPRPEQPRYVDELVEKLPFYQVRHLVRPGLTGWAQVKYGYAGSEADAIEKLQYEFYYLRHQRLSLDLRIIVRTLRSVFQRAGR